MGTFLGFLSWLNHFLSELNPVFQLLTLAALIVYVWKTWTMAREMKLSREEHAKPQVLCYFEHNKSSRRMCDLVLKNFGNSTAFNVRFVFSPQLQSHSLGTVAEKSLRIMPPGYEWRTFFSSFLVRDYSAGSEGYTACITYDWDTPRKHESYETVFDIKSLPGTLWVDQPTLEDALQELAEVIRNRTNENSLQEIAESVEDIAKTLGKQAKVKRAWSK